MRGLQALSGSEGGLGISVSVLIPVFNRVKLISAAIDSALQQDVEGLSVTVVDNCSDDGTWEVLKEFESSRCRIIRNERNLGLFGNFNRCGEFIDGEFSLFLCSDDRLEPGYLKAAVALMSRSESVVMVTSRGQEIGSNGRRGSILADWFAPGIYLGSSVPPAWFWCTYFCGTNALNYPSGILFRTSALQAALPFRPELGAPADIDMYLRVLRHGDLAVADMVGCLVMRHPGQEGTKLRKAGELLQQDLNLLEEYRPELEKFRAYKMIQRQSACAILATIVRTFRSNWHLAFEIWRHKGVTVPTMCLAAATRVAIRMRARVFKTKSSRYLQRFEAP